jgi:murein DD-endopeptidase MepM/ murein hydrolase activator NlpD
LPNSHGPDEPALNATPAKGRSARAHLRRVLLGVGMVLSALAGLAIAAFWEPLAARLGTGLQPPAMPGEDVIAEVVLPPALALVSAEPAVEAQPVRAVAGTLKSGETLTGLLERLGADRAQANAALFALYDPGLVDSRKVRPGLQLELRFADRPGRGEPSLVGLMLRPEAGRAFTVSRRADGSYAARETHVRMSPALRRVRATIETSLYEAALRDGAGDQQVVDFADIFAFDVDFQREIREGDGFEMVYEVWLDERGQPVQAGALIYAELNGQFTDRAFYRFTPEDDAITDYYDAKGESARKLLMKTPINGARLSSSFGMRRHPISGYNKLHRGTDFAAATGTPIYAAGNGSIVKAGTNGGYGKYVRIRHANGYETAYAHLSGYGKGIKAGASVRQGDVIGYVGSTGASTGPHLHYEVLLDGEHIDPMGLKLPTGRTLEGDILTAFETARGDIDALRAELAGMPDGARLAQLER